MLWSSLVLNALAIAAQDVGTSGPSELDASCMIQSATITKSYMPMSTFADSPIEQPTSLALAQVPAMYDSQTVEAKQQNPPNWLLGVHPKPHSQPACPEIHATLPLVSLLLVLTLTVFWLLRGSAGAGTAEVARSTGLFVQFCGMTNYSIVILEAYQLSKTLHHDAAFSGQLIGIYMAATAVGGIATSVMLRHSPEIWKTHPRQVLICGQLFNITGFCIYAWVTSYATYNVIDTDQEASSLSHALLVSRIGSGIGHGLGASLLQVSFAHLTPVEERPAQMTRFMFTNTLGIGLGPMIAAGMRLIEFCPPGMPVRFELVGQAQLVLAAVALGSVLLYPNLEDVEDFVEGADSPISRTSSATQLYTPSRLPSSGSLAAKNSYMQRLIVCGCMFSTCIRAMVTSGVEGATSLLMETEYHFQPQTIGMIIGATFLVCFPVKLFIDCSKQSMTVFQWIRALCFVSVCGSMLLFRYNWHFLILADVLLFPSLYLSDGMVRGLMQQYALPTGDILDQTGTTLWAMLLNSFGRFCGPWLARWLLERVNQSGYAALQIFLAVVFWVMFELTIVYPSRILNVEQESDAPEQLGSKKQIES